MKNVAKIVRCGITNSEITDTVVNFLLSSILVMGMSYALLQVWHSHRYHTSESWQTRKAKIQQQARRAHALGLPSTANPYVSEGCATRECTVWFDAYMDAVWQYQQDK